MNRYEDGKRHKRRAAKRSACRSSDSIQPPLFRGSRVPSDATTWADEAFHRRFPTRSICMRPASRAEVDRMEANRNSGGVLPGPAGWRWFALVRYDASGPIARQFLMAPAGVDYDLSEAEALAKWDDGTWPAGHLDSAIALQRALAQGDYHLRIRLPIGPENYPDAAAATRHAHAVAACAGMPSPMLVEVCDGLHALWPARDHIDPVTRYVLQAAGIEIVDAEAVLAEVTPSDTPGGAP